MCLEVTYWDIFGTLAKLPTTENTAFRISPSHWTLSVADISNDIDQLVESLNITETPRSRTFRSTSPLNDLRTHPNSHLPTRPSQAPHLTTPHQTTTSPSFPNIRTSPFIRASSPHLNVTERLSKFSKSCNDLLYNLDNTLGAAARYGEDFSREQTLGETEQVPIPDLEDGADVTEEEGRADSRGSFRKGESPVRDIDETLSSRNIGSRLTHYDKRPWQEVEDVASVERFRRAGSDRSPRRRVASTRKRTASMESQSTYDNYHSTKQSFIVRPTCITPINTTSLYYTNPGSRPITPLNTSELIYISSRSPSPEILFPPYRKPSPSNRRLPTRSRGTSPLKVSFEEEPSSQDKESDLDCSRETQETYLDCSRSKQENTLDCSRCPTPLKTPLRTSSPKSLLDRSISPFDQMVYVPGKKGTPVSKEDLSLSSSTRDPDLSSTIRDSSLSPFLTDGAKWRGEVEAKWSGYDSDGDGYRTANTSPEDGAPWW